MFENSEQLLEFVDRADEVLMDQVFEGAISDICLYEDQYIVGALDKYIEMLETDTVDEKFEEHLSTVILPYFSATAAFYENVMVLEEGPMGKIKIASTLAKSKLKDIKKGMDPSIFKAKRALQNAPDRLKAKIGANKAALKRGIAAAGEKLSNAAFDARFKGRALMKSMRAKYGPKALANKIKRGYEGAKKWAAGTALGQKVLKAYASGMAKRAGKLDQKAVDTAEKAKKAALAVNK